MSIVLVLGVMAGCGAGGDAGNNSAGDAAGNNAGDAGAAKSAAAELDKIDKPTTLTIYAPVSDAIFAKFFADPLKAKFPNLTLEQLKPTKPNSEGAAELVEQGNTPDLVYAVPGWYGKEKLIDLYTDLTPLIKKYNFDMNRLDPVVLETLKTYSPGKIDFIPESVTTLILLYNKDIFDKFGVPYPKDGMTWDDALALAAKVTRTEGDKTYYGFNMDRFFPINNNQLSLAFVDGKTNKANVANNPGWATYFNTMKRFYELPGNKMTDKQFGNYNMFSKDKNVAMFSSRLEQLSNMVIAEEAGLNWDLVTTPTFKEAPNASSQVNDPYLAITPASQHKDEAFKVIAYLLSDEVQLAHNLDGRLTVLKDKTIRDQFGKNIKELAKKNIAAATKLQAAKPRTFTIYDDYVVTSLAKSFSDVITGKTDVNTALRQGEDAANQLIEENKR
jgi:multiple sugar transport system substrate-binding protein